jgi:hypothetical protein
MAVYRIVCVHRITSPPPLAHGHVIAVGTVDEDTITSCPTLAWTAGEVVRSVEEGDRFVVGPKGSATNVTIAKQVCPQCGVGFIQIEPLGVLVTMGDCLL